MTPILYLDYMTLKISVFFPEFIFSPFHPVNYRVITPTMPVVFGVVYTLMAVVVHIFGDIYWSVHEIPTSYEVQHL